MSTAEQRARREICELGARSSQRGLCRRHAPATSASASADGWLMTPTNSSLGELDPDKLSKLDASGKHLAGDPPTKEALLHRAIYDERPQGRRHRASALHARRGDLLPRSVVPPHCRDDAAADHRPTS